MDLVYVIGIITDIQNLTFTRSPEVYLFQWKGHLTPRDMKL